MNMNYNYRIKLKHCDLKRLLQMRQIVSAYWKALRLYLLNTIF